MTSIRAMAPTVVRPSATDQGVNESAVAASSLPAMTTFSSSGKTSETSDGSFYTRATQSLYRGKDWRELMV